MTRKIGTATRRASPPARAATAAAKPPPAESLLDLEHDDLRPVADELKRVTGHDVSKCTILRAVQGKNADGVRLAAVFVHGEWVTSRRAIAAYIEQLTAAHQCRNARALITRRARAAVATRARKAADTARAGGAE